MSRRTVNAHRFADREQAAISVTRFRVGRVATLPLFFLLPATRVGGLYLLIPIKFHEVSLESKTDSQPKLVIGSAVAIRGTLSIAIILAVVFDRYRLRCEKGPQPGRINGGST